MRGVILVAVCLSVSGCLAYDNPTQPDYVPPSTTNPFTLTIGSLPAGSGMQAVVSARVQNVNGAPLAGIPVMFATDTGTLSADSGITTSLGLATTTWSGGGSATITATTGNLNARTIVVSNPTSTPTPTPALAFLNVSGSAQTGALVTFSVSSAAMGQTWQWSFGDGGTASTTAFSTSHVYNQPGVYTANVSSSGTVASSATITVTASTVTTPPPPALFAASLACTPSTTLILPCNITATSNGSVLPASSITNVSWDWGDGSFGPITSTPVNTHPYANPGTYTIFATVVGGPSGGSSSQTVASISVTVPKAP